jgi:hypothetical protein
VSATRRTARALACVTLLVLPGCARAPRDRAAIQERYDMLAAAVRTGDAAGVRRLWTADPAAPGSPLVALDHATITGGHVREWATSVQRYRMVGDTAVVDAGVRSLMDDDGHATVTSQVVRAFWVRGAGGWTIVRTEPLGAADVESTAR